MPRITGRRTKRVDNLQVDPKIQIKPIDPKRFVPGGENIERLKIAMREAPALFEKFQRLVGDMEAAMAALSQFVGNLSKEDNRV
jgi:hypothetical protein